MGDEERFAADDPFSIALNEWLQAALSSGEYRVKGLLTGWSLVLENYDPDIPDEVDGSPDKMIFFASSPDSRIAQDIARARVLEIYHEETFKRVWFDEWSGSGD